MFDVTAHASPYNRTMCIDSFRTRFQGLVSCTTLGGFRADWKVLADWCWEWLGPKGRGPKGPWAWALFHQMTLLVGALLCIFCYTTLDRVVLFYDIGSTHPYVTSYYMISSSVIWYYVITSRTILHHIMVYCNILCGTHTYHLTLYYIVLYHIIL